MIISATEMTTAMMIMIHFYTWLLMQRGSNAALVPSSPTPSHACKRIYTPHPCEMASLHGPKEVSHFKSARQVSFLLCGPVELQVPVELHLDSPSAETPLLRLYGSADTSLARREELQDS